MFSGHKQPKTRKQQQQHFLVNIHTHTHTHKKRMKEMHWDWIEKKRNYHCIGQRSGKQIKGIIKQTN